MKKRFVKWLCMLLALTLCLSVGYADERADGFEMPWWSMLRDDDTLLTITLPMENAAEEGWEFDVSEENMLELIALEVLGDEPMESDEPLWIGDFAAAGRKTGVVLLQLTRRRADAVVQINLLRVRVYADGTLEVLDALEHRQEYEGKMYYVQAGAYRQRENAQNQLQRLVQNGVEGLIKYSGTLYKVQAGAFAVRENAEARLKVLKNAGFDDAFVTTELEGEIIEAAGLSEAPFIVYEVEQNDTMWGLARRFLGSGAMWPLIAELNDIGAEIRVGQILLIPR